MELEQNFLTDCLKRHVLCSRTHLFDEQTLIKQCKKNKNRSLITTLFFDYVGPWGLSHVFWSTLSNSSTVSLRPGSHCSCDTGVEERGTERDNRCRSDTSASASDRPRAAWRRARKNVWSKGECLGADEIRPRRVFFFFHYHSLQRREERRRRRYSEKPWLRPFISVPRSLQQTEGCIFHKSGDWNRQIIPVSAMGMRFFLSFYFFPEEVYWCVLPRYLAGIHNCEGKSPEIYRLVFFRE